MAAKPRVHEIASELKVDSKELLRTLRDMGEHVKGPSSSIEPPVARRLVATFTPKRVQSLTRPVIITAVPAPPGTRSRVDVPLPLSLSADSAVFADVQDPPPAPLRSPVAAPPSPPVRQRVVRQAPEPSAQTPPPVRTKPPMQASAQPLVRRKPTPKPAVSAPIARLERSTTQTRALSPAGTAPGEAASWARRNIVIRADREWSLYKFSSAERQHWISAGLKLDQAHVAAMCRAFRGRGLMLSPASLSQRLLTGRTVLDEFNRGSNAVEVLLLLADARRVRLEPEFDARIIKVLQKVEEPAQESSLTLPADTAAVSVPRIADFMSGLIGTAPTSPELEAFNRERLLFERTGRSGALIRLYAHAHGVVRDGVLKTMLLENVPAHVDLSQPKGNFAGLVQKAVRDRRFYHVSNSAAGSVLKATQGQLLVPDGEDLPSTSGFAVLQSGPSDEQANLLVWHHSGLALAAAIIPYAQLAGGAVLRPEVSTVVAGSALGGPSTRAANITAALSIAIRHSFDSPPRRGGPGLRHSERPKGVSKGRPKLRGPASVDADSVVLVYAAGEVVDESTYAREGHRAVSRWLVGGHFRLQPYPSTGETRKIWIAPHEAGARDGSLASNDRVRVLR